MFAALFATVFVCGSIVSSSSSTDSYLQPVPKIHYVVSYSDTTVEETPADSVSDSDEEGNVSVKPTSTTTSAPEIVNVEDGVTVVEFIDDEDEDYTSETLDVEEDEIDEQFLYMTTVTTKLPVVNNEEMRTTTTLRTTSTK